MAADRLGHHRGLRRPGHGGRPAQPPPRLPDIPGMDDFAGTSFHSSRWDHSQDLTGRRVAVIGSGSSAAQLIPPVARQAERLEVFQRTPNWVIPKPDATFNAAVRLAFRFVPGLQRAYREYIYRYAEATLYPALARGWSEDLLRRRALNHLRDQVKDPELRARLTPDYPPGCKRVVIDSRFYPALTRPNVDVVTDKIVRITEKGVQTTESVHEADTIVYATGFRSTEFLAPMRVTGRDGVDLATRWAERRGGLPGHRGAGLPEHVPAVRSQHQPRAQLDHLHDRMPGEPHHELPAAPVGRPPTGGAAGGHGRLAPHGWTRRWGAWCGATAAGAGTRPPTAGSPTTGRAPRCSTAG
ncbi:flavin-containing monooxygenase [Nonomuraea ferruginea]